MSKRDDNKTIYLGSGDLMVKEITGDTMPKYSEFTDADLLGYISGGATIEYKPTYYEAKDDSGKVTKVIITEEEATLKSGVLTWNGETLKKLCATARVTESGNVRTVKIGGVGNNDGKSYVFCFHHKDPIDGDVWILIRGVNQSGFSLAFVKDKETVIDAEIKCLPMDDEGSLIEYTEEITAE